MPIDFEEQLNMSESEIINDFYQLATMITFLRGKKLIMQNIFLLILQDTQINKIAKLFLDMESNLEICTNLLKIDPTLAKSKLIHNFASEQNKIKNGK